MAYAYRLTAFNKACGWQVVNDNDRSARRCKANTYYKGVCFSGPFYWESAKEAYHAARRLIRMEKATQVKIETISGREAGRVYDYQITGRN